MTLVTWTDPALGTDLSIAAPLVDTALSSAKAAINGNLDAATNFTAAGAQAVGANQAGQTVKGAVNIPTAQSTSSASFTTLATPDQVTGIVLPANGLIAVWYQATWQESVAGAARAAIFVGANQVKFQAGGGPSVQQVGTGNGTPSQNTLLATGAGGLASSGQSYTGDVATGQIVGSQTVAPVVSAGPCYIFAAAGTYTVSVQFNSFGGGSVTASNRKLWVQAISFA